MTVENQTETTVTTTKTVVVTKTGDSEGFAVIPFVAGMKAAEGQRISKALFKNYGERKAERDSACVTIPVLSLDTIKTAMENPAVLAAVQGLLHEVQSKIIRGKVLAGAVVIDPKEIALPAIIEAMQIEEKGRRFSAEFVASWFDEVMKPSIELAALAKAGTTAKKAGKEIKESIAQACNRYKELLKGAVSSKADYTPAQREAVAKVLALAQGDAVAIKIGERLQQMEKQEKAVEVFDVL